jgi:RNA polymerase sigma factor FliA
METSSFSGKNCSSTADIWQRFESGALSWAACSAEARGAIVQRHATKVKIIALRMKAKLPQHVELRELISAGSLGLMEALEKFNAEMGIKFDTFAENRIKGAMLDELRRLDWFSRGLRQRVRLLEDHLRQVEQFSGREPTAEELQKLTGLSDREVQEGLEALHNQVIISVDALEESLLHSGGNARDDPYAHTLQQELIDKLAQLIDELTAREQMVLSLYYSDELNMRETALVMDITEGRVSQLHSQALRKLRKKFAMLHQDHHPSQSNQGEKTNGLRQKHARARG